MVQSVAERFWAKVDKRGENECWPWTASVRPDGYGQFSCGGRPGPAHAAAYRLECGDVPFRAYVRQSCGNKLCVNPAHLALETDESRFWAKVEKTDGCWNWTGARSPDGYGLFKVDAYRGVNAHRFSFERENGPIGESYVCHKCDNRRCVRPDHLFLGDVRINWADMVLKGRHPKMRTAKAIALAVAIFGANSAAANTVTTNYSLNKPTVGADSNNWGSLSNANWDSLDSIIFGIQGTANAACPKAGCTFTGGISGTTASFSGASSFGSTLSVTGAIAATGGVVGNVTGNVSGNVSGNVTGNVSGSSGSTTGNAATATALQNSQVFSAGGDVNCPGVSFNGTGGVALSCSLAGTGGGFSGGDATHVVGMTVDTKGRVLSASAVPINVGLLGFLSASAAGGPGSLTIPTNNGNVYVNFGKMTAAGANSDTATLTFAAPYSSWWIPLCSGAGGGPASVAATTNSTIRCHNNVGSPQDVTWIVIGQ